MLNSVFFKIKFRYNIFRGIHKTNYIIIMLFLYSLIVVDLNNITMPMIVMIHTCLISYYLRRICRNKV